MKPHDACPSLERRALVEERALDVIEGRAPELAEHARTCAPCGEILERERRLLAVLTSLGPAPDVDVPVPALPTGRLLSHPARFRNVASAAAAVLLVVAGAALWNAPQGASTDGLAGDGRVGTAVADSAAVGSLEDVTPLLDDDLLALTMGYEAVVMRRPTER